MARITKGMIAAAQAELACIHDLATDPDAYQGLHATYLYHAPAASRHLDTLKAAKVEAPAWVATNAKYFKACGWRVY